MRATLTLAVPVECLRGGQRGEAVAGELEDAVPPGRGPRRAAQVPRGRRERRHDHAPLVRVELRGPVQQGAPDGRERLSAPAVQHAAVEDDLARERGLLGEHAGESRLIRIGAGISPHAERVRRMRADGNGQNSEAWPVVDDTTAAGGPPSSAASRGR